MEDLNIDELRQLVTFYKQRSSDLEFSLLQTQLKLNKAISLQPTDETRQAVKTVVDKKIKYDS
jgi:hypothetical protein